MMKRKKKREEEAQPAEAVEETVEQVVEAEAPAEGVEAIDPETTVEYWKDRYVRTLAELDNYRKRTERARAAGQQYAIEDLCRRLIPSLDALGLAIEAAGDADEIKGGVELALKDLLRVLGDKGMKPIDALHQQFDPRFHEAVGMQPSEEHPAGTVLAEMQRGYMLHDRVLRASRVQIAMAMPEMADEPETAEADVEGDPETGDDATVGEQA
ncbi:MAG: nucleotide exchange factor GrpE [Planctomycetota bacterium]